MSVMEIFVLTIAIVHHILGIAVAILGLVQMCNKSEK